MSVLGNVEAGSDTDRVVQRALVALRIAGLFGMVVAIVVYRGRLDRPPLGLVVAGAMVGITVWSMSLFRWQPDGLLSRRFVVSELLAGVVVQAADGWVLRAREAHGAPAFGSVWPLAGVISAGLRWGPWPGALAGLVVGVAHAAGAPAPFVAHGLQYPPEYGNGPLALPTVFVTVLFVLAGGGVGVVAGWLRQADSAVSRSRERESLVRRLHDGVLQSLAMIERRSPDRDIARLARDADRDLRQFLFPPTDPWSVALSEVVRSVADRTGLDPQLVVTEPLPARPASVVDAVAGAVGEALANTAKHADASTVTVLASIEDGGVSVTVCDDGDGFDPTHTNGGTGLASSIAARVADVGGRSQVRSEPGAGTEVFVWVP